MYGTNVDYWNDTNINYWIELDSCPIELPSNCCWLNTQEFVTCPKYGTSEATPEMNGIWRYNTTLNKWILHYKYPYDCITTTPTSHPLLVDQNQQIYLYGYDPALIKSNQITTIPDTKNIGYNSSAVLIKNSYHIICGKNNKKHLKWNAKNKRFKDIWTFDDFKKGNESHGLIYMQSNNKLLFFGGSENYKYFNCVWSAQMNKKKIKWKKLSVNMPELADFGYVLVTYQNKEYILVFGGLPNRNSDKPHIYIWNINESMHMYPSKISCPMAGRFTAIAETYAGIKNELLVYGFTRAVNSEYMIDDIMMSIARWNSQFDSECCIYLLHASGQFWKIQLQHLF